MSASLFDVAYNWLGTGPGVPKFTMPIEHTPTRLHRFGDVLDNVPQDSLRLQFPLPDQLRAPVNGTLRRGTSSTQDWPVLKHFDGAPLVPGEHDLLLETWPSAFRRLEYIFTSREVPTSLDGSELPQAPAPRWFWIRGVGEGIETPAQTIANVQFAGSSISIDVANFLDGRAPLYVAAGDQLTTFDPAEEIEIRVFDGNGLVLDPDYIFFTFHRLAKDSDFQRLYVEWSSSIADWNPIPRRHVLVFSDKKGAPYVSRADPDAPEQPPPIVPARTLLAGSETIPIPGHGVVIIDDGTPAYTALETAPFVELALPGEHQRISLMPHGTLGNTAKASFSEYSFFRLQVVDLARWFPRNPNPRNALLGPDGLRRYTDGNEVIPLIDGRNAFRAWYRAIRATYAVETYASDEDIPALDPAATIGEPEPQDKALAKVLLCHAWLESQCAYLGRRAMLAAPRVQPGVDPEEDFPAAATFLGSLRRIGALPPPDTPPDEAADENRRLWWLLYTPAAGDPALPAGAYVEIRQLGFLEDFRGDDPRLPGDELTADIFGVIAPLDPDAPTSWGFVSTENRLLIPALFGDDETPTAMLRAVVWTGDGEEPDRIDWRGAVKGQRRTRAYGEVSLLTLLPDAPTTPPEFDRDDVDQLQGIRLEFEGVTGRVIVVLEPGVLKEDRVPVVVLNARTGESYGNVFDANQSTPIRIIVEPFALRDKILVGFPEGVADADPTACDVFFVLEVTEAMLLSGAALAHPTELTGMLRDAISAGIDTRVLGWHSFEHPPEDLAFVTPGVLASTGASINGQSGEAILDQTGRRESGVHHQKGGFVRTALPLHDEEGKLREHGGAMAFVGGIDPRPDRYDSDPHPQLDPDRTGSKPWHDIHCRIRGRASWDVYRNYRHRWNVAVARPDLTTHFGTPLPLPSTIDPILGPDVEANPNVTMQDGPHTVQVNRTIAPHLEEYAGFADPETGDLSVLKAYERTIAEARQFLYIEDQYFWSRHIAELIHDALLEGRIEFVMLLLPKRLSESPLLDLMLYAQRRRALSILQYGVPEVPADPATAPENVSNRVVIFTIHNDQQTPVYVHCKSMVADDLWMNISSSNFSQRSLTYDSEIGAATIDRRIRRGGGLTPRQFRVDLMADHLRLLPEEKSLVEDPRDAFRLMKAILAGEVAGRKLGIEEAGIAAMDIFHTHLGTLPGDLDGTFVDAVNLAVDPNGLNEELNLLVDLQNLLGTLKSGTDTVTFGGLGTLRLDFDVSSLGAATNIQVRVQVTVPDPPQVLALGPFPANASARVGLVRIGVPYVVRATPELIATPGVPLAQPMQRTVTPAAPSSVEGFGW